MVFLVRKRLSLSELQIILEAHERAALSSTEYTDDASLFEEMALPVRVVAGDAQNIKLTYLEDSEEADRSLRLKDIQGSPLPDVRVGHGYDTHALVPGENIIICGVNIPHDKSKLGHSDAGVVFANLQV